MAKKPNTTDRDRERGEGDPTLLKATFVAADGTVIDPTDFLDGPPTSDDGETVGVATGELYDGAVAKAFPQEIPNGNGT